MSNVKSRSMLNRTSAIAIAVAASAACLTLTPRAGAQTVPSDPAATCTVTAANFATWFQSGTVTLNGVVNPANSVAFPNLPNCSFYQWSMQMFLWLTSPAPSIYGGGGPIFNSPVFFDVSPPDQNGVRTLLPHTIGIIRPFPVRAQQVGPHGLPVLFDRQGRMLEVERSQIVATAKLQIRDRSGKLVEIGRASVGEGGRLSLTDAHGKAIELPELPAKASAKAARMPQSTISVQKFLVNNIPIFIDPFGNLVEVEQGQADTGVLQAQNGSLIYYATFVNDVYAYFLTGSKDGAIVPGNDFPTSMTDLNNITTFAAGHGKTFVDPSALAVEVKSSWIDASTLSNASSYIQIEATVPTYNQSNPDLWVPNGQKTVTLALTGIHVVGSTAGHPEMIWATFEHTGNAPDAAYTYINSMGQATSVAQNTAGTWLFSASNSTGPFNQMHMNEQFPGLSIASVPPFHISPSDTIRWKAWGGASDVSPNPIDGSTAASNSEIISINNSVHGMMVAGDVRANYIFKGATWTIGGFSPNASNQVGTSALSNSTMETYQQGVDTTAANGFSNCFSCHTSASAGFAGTDVSHIFGGIKPLF